MREAQRPWSEGARVILSNLKLIRYTRTLTEKGEVVWAERYECPTCHTQYIPDDMKYRICDGCGCYTQVYIRKWGITKCQSCVTGKPWDAKAPPTRAPWDKRRG